MKTIWAIFCALVITYAVQGSDPDSKYISPNFFDNTANSSDLVFKGKVISCESYSKGDPRFPLVLRVSKLQIITILRGSVATNLISIRQFEPFPLFNTYRPDSPYVFKPGSSYIVFTQDAKKVESSFFSPSESCSINFGAPPFPSQENAFTPVVKDSIVKSTTDKPVTGTNLDDLCWTELNKFLATGDKSNVLYAIDELDHCSLVPRHYDSSIHVNGFDRSAVLNAILPLTTNADPEIACRSLDCYIAEFNSTGINRSFAPYLVKIADCNPSPQVRLAAITALSGLDAPLITNSLAGLLNDPDEEIRTKAVLLLLNSPKGFAVSTLKNTSMDSSVQVRSATAFTIGYGRYAEDLPTLEKLFRESPIKLNQSSNSTANVPGTGINRAYIDNVHSSSGLALLNFPPTLTSDILKSHLDDSEFHGEFAQALKK